MNIKNWLSNISFQKLKEALFLTKRFIYTIIIVLFVLYFCSGVYLISPNEIGVLLRFGKIIDSKVTQGIHYKIPWPIDKIEKIPIKVVHNMVISDFLKDAEFLKKTDLPSYCITGDNNIVNIDCVIQYSISDATKYLFNIKNNQEALHYISCNIIIKCLSMLPVDEILTHGKIKIGFYIKDEMQNKLDKIESGLSVVFVELKEIKPPEKVQIFFDDVIKAKVDKEKFINEALSYRNTEMTTVKGSAYSILEDAKAYKESVIVRSDGEIAYFNELFSQYKKSPSIVRKNLYIKFAKDVLSKIEKKYIISKDDKINSEKLKIFIGE